jgi:hypothetical protein
MANFMLVSAIAQGRAVASRGRRRATRALKEGYKNEKVTEKERDAVLAACPGCFRRAMFGLWNE